MKLTVCIFLLSVMGAMGAANAQRVSMNVRNTPLEQALVDISKQANFVLIYDESDLYTSRPVTYAFKNKELTEALDMVLAGQPLQYTIRGKSIVISKKQAAKQVPQAATLQQSIRGKVSDEEGNPLAGVSLRMKSDAKKVVVTDAGGNFNLPLTAAGETIVVTFIGYAPYEFTAKFTGKDLSIHLQKTENKVDEVVVTGIFQRPVESFTGAATVVTAEQLQRFGTRNIVTSLRNIDPSFNIIENNAFGSDPNRMPEVQLRGNSNIPNITELQDQTRTDLNTPLVILDGFESTLRKLYDLNENEVETITILKDASATAMYGSRGANGVIVIKTKPPQPGKLRLSYRVDGNVEFADLSGYNLLKAREKLELERVAGYYNNGRPATDLSLKNYYNYVLDEVNRGVETDWLSQPTRNSYGQRHNLRIEGGHEAFRYSASAQYNDIQGSMKGSDRGTFNGNITLSYIYSKLRFQNNTQMQEQRSSESPYGTFSQYVQQNPYWRIYDDNGEILKFLGDPGNGMTGGRWGNPLPTNPLYNASLHTFDKSRLSELTNNTMVDWNLMPGLRARLSFGITKSIGQSDRFRPAEHTAFANYTGDDIFRKGDYRYGVDNALRYDGSATLEYDKRLGKHTIFGGFNYNIRQSEAFNYSILAEGFNNPNFDFLPMALQYAKDGKPAGSESLVRSVGFTSNGAYIYDNRYFADASIRVDGSSQFGAESRFAPFWSFGLGWNLHEEQFLKENPYVNRLKLRGSIGTTGSQAFNAYQSLSTYQYYLDDRYYNWNGAYLLGLGNPDLRWQTNFKNNIGLDAELFGRTLLLNADYYVETTKDLVSSVDLRPSNGFPSYVDNIGRLRNKGFEVKATVFLVNNERLSWSLTGAMVQNKNTILETSKALKDAQLALRNNGNNADARIYEEGYSSNTIWAVPSRGIDPSTGKELYMGKDGQLTYAWRGADVTAVGNTDPDLFGNFSTFFRYKDVSLNLAFGYRFGGQQYNQTLVSRVETGNYQYNVDARVWKSRWQHPGDAAAFKGLGVTEATYKTSRFVQNENMLQLQNVNVQYNLRTPRLLSALKLEALSVAANFADAFYLSSIKRERGLDYPFARQLSFNINVTF